MQAIEARFYWSAYIFFSWLRGIFILLCAQEEVMEESEDDMVFGLFD